MLAAATIVYPPVSKTVLVGKDEEKRLEILKEV
jgi:hypothetical protein